MQFILNVLRGAVIGIANVIPGVSGGTMAVVMNIYDKLIGAVSRFFRDWKRNLLFLLPIALGAGAGILALSSAIKFLLERFPTAVNFLFLGLILGSVPMIYKRAMGKSGFKPVYLAPFVLALGVMVGLSFLSPEETAGGVMKALTAGNFFQLTAASAVAAVAMLLPGVSGSMMMMVFGTYFTVITAISDLNIPILIPVAVGVLAGLLAGAKLIDLFLRKFPQGTFWVVLGLVFGSLISVYQSSGFQFDLGGLVAILLLLLGAGIALLFSSDRLARGRKKEADADFPAEPPDFPGESPQA